MRSIRKFAYAAALTFSIFAVQPTLANAEDARGVFKLSHDVHWQDHLLRAGDYTFTLKTIGQPFLVLRGVDGTGTDAVVLVRDFETPRLDEGSRLVLVSRNGESFVSTMELPNYDMTLNFNVPSENPSK
ncbi:MAG TPA: hypothetical protein VN946_22825 [Terriglobales bacterium]|jgi:hypothetical protein|nr:hypothetical protein [Terriglobales bacterium]